MKTSNLHPLFLTAVLGLFLLAGPAAKADEKDKASGKIREISASGNVRVYLTIGDDEKISVVGKYDESNSDIQLEDGQLSIASTATEEFTVVVTVRHLDALEADGQAYIQSLNDLEIASENVHVYDDATIQLKTDDGDLFLYNVR